MVRLAEEAGDVGGQRRQHLEPLVRALRRPDEIAIVAEALEIERAQPLDQARIDQRRLGLGQIDAGVGVQHRRDVAGSRGRVISNSPSIRAIRRRARRRTLAFTRPPPSRADMTLSSSMRPIMRPSIASMPRTKDLTKSLATSGVGWMFSVGSVRMSETASTSRPMICAPTWTTMMTCRAEASVGGKPSRSARSTIGSTDAAQIDDAAHVGRRVRQRRRRRPAADLAHRHDVDAELLHADAKGDEFARAAGGDVDFGHGLNLLRQGRVLRRSRCGWCARRTCRCRGSARRARRRGSSRRRCRAPGR